MNSRKLVVSLALAATLHACGKKPVDTEDDPRGLVMTTEFLESYSGKFMDTETQELFVVYSSGGFEWRQRRTLGVNGETLHTPCYLLFSGTLSRVIERHGRSRSTLHPHASHLIELEFKKIYRGGLRTSSPFTWTNACEALQETEKAALPTNKELYLEILNEGHLRFHTNTGETLRPGEESSKGDFSDENYLKI